MAIKLTPPVNQLTLERTRCLQIISEAQSEIKRLRDRVAQCQIDVQGYQAQIDCQHAAHHIGHSPLAPGRTQIMCLDCGLAWENP